MRRRTYACDTQVLNGGDSMACTRRPNNIVSTLALLTERSRISVASALFKRTSEIKLALLERVQVGEGVPDELRREPHLGEGCIVFTSVCASLVVNWGLVAPDGCVSRSLEGDKCCRILVSYRGGWR